VLVGVVGYHLVKTEVISKETFENKEINIENHSSKAGDSDTENESESIKMPYRIVDTAQ